MLKCSKIKKKIKIILIEPAILENTTTVILLSSIVLAT